MTTSSLTQTFIDKVEPLGRVGTSRKLTVTSSTSNTALTGNISRISMRAVGANIRYSIGTTAQTADTNSHFIANGERLDLAVPPGANIAVWCEVGTNGTLEITELN